MYMIDAADAEQLDEAKSELHSLVTKPQLSGIPVSFLPSRICAGGSMSTRDGVTQW